MKRATMTLASASIGLFVIATAACGGGLAQGKAQTAASADGSVSVKVKLGLPNVGNPKYDAFFNDVVALEQLVADAQAALDAAPATLNKAMNVTEATDFQTALQNISGKLRGKARDINASPAVADVSVVAAPGVTLSPDEQAMMDTYENVVTDVAAIPAKLAPVVPRSVDIIKQERDARRERQVRLQRHQGPDHAALGHRRHPQSHERHGRHQDRSAGRHREVPDDDRGDPGRRLERISQPNSWGLEERRGSFPRPQLGERARCWPPAVDAGKGSSVERRATQRGKEGAVSLAMLRTVSLVTAALAVAASGCTVATVGEETATSSAALATGAVVEGGSAVACGPRFVGSTAEGSSPAGCRSPAHPCATINKRSPPRAPATSSWSARAATENIVVDKPLSLLGAGDTTVILPASSNPAPCNDSSRVAAPPAPWCSSAPTR